MFNDRLKANFASKAIHSALVCALKSSVCAAQMKAEARRALSAAVIRGGGSEFPANAAAALR